MNSEQPSLAHVANDCSFISPGYRQENNFQLNQTTPSTQTACICLFSCSALPGKTSHRAAELRLAQVTPEQSVSHCQQSEIQISQWDFSSQVEICQLPWSCLCKSLVAHSSATLKSMTASTWQREHDSASLDTFFFKWKGAHRSSADQHNK